MIAERRLARTTGRFENMRLNDLGEEIDRMEGKIFDAAVVEVCRRQGPRVGLNGAYMRAKAEYARRVGDFEEAERLDGTWDGIKQRLEVEEKAGWERIRQSGPEGKSIADFVEMSARLFGKWR